MKWSASVLAACIVASSTVEAFQPNLTIAPHSASSLRTTSFVSSSSRSTTVTNKSLRRNPGSLFMSSYSVGIVGATGAVGKEIRQCLEKRSFPVETLRIFGSDRSAGTSVETKYGTVVVELFDVKAARECDVVFLAVSGEFALQHAKALTEGDDGCVVIDNSVRFVRSITFLPNKHTYMCVTVRISVRTRRSARCARKQWTRNE